MRLGVLLVPIIYTCAAATAQAQDAAQRCAVSGDVSDRVSACRQALHEDSLDAYSHYNLGLAFTQTNELDSAMAHWRAATRIRPEYASPHAMIANVLADRRQPAEAMAQADSAIQVEPKNGLGYNAKARILISMNRFSDAVDAARQSVALLPNDPMVRGNFADALARSHQYEESIAEARKVLALNGSRALTYGLLAGIYLEQQRNEKALAAADTAIAADSMMLHPYQVRIYALWGLHRADEAKAAQARVGQLFPEQKAVIAAMSMTSQSSHTSAADAATALVAIDTGADLNVRMARANALYRAGKKAEAIMAVRDFVRQHPDNAYGWSALGYVDAMALHYTNALAEWKKAVELDPTVLDRSRNVKEMREQFLQITADPKAATLADLDKPIPEDKPVRSEPPPPSRKPILLNVRPSQPRPIKSPAKP